MKWLIPAKTFLIGEYTALFGEPALIMTTEPCFLLEIGMAVANTSLPVNSPAWNFWHNIEQNNCNLFFGDPYSGLGGMGASSAQFLGAFYASKHLAQLDFSRTELLSTYLNWAWDGEGMPPSGYDLLAQHMGGCAYIHKNMDIYHSYAWPFTDISGILIHTQKKLATHEYLRTFESSISHSELTNIANNAIQAFTLCDSKQFIVSINAYAKELMALGLQAEHTRTILASLPAELQLLAAKGCGAMGADIILLIVPSLCFIDSLAILQKSGYHVVASSENIAMRKQYF